MIDYRKLFEYIGEESTDIFGMVDYMLDEFNGIYGRLPTITEFISALDKFRAAMEEWKP